MSRLATTRAELTGASRLRRLSHGLRSAPPWQLKFELYFLLRCAQVRALLPLSVCSSSSPPSATGVPGAPAGQCSQPGSLVCRSVRRTEPGGAIKSRSTQARGAASGASSSSLLPRGTWCAAGGQGPQHRWVSGSRLTARPPGFVESPGREGWSRSAIARPLGVITA
jgi:hypothetical protein